MLAGTLSAKLDQKSDKSSMFAVVVVVEMIRCDQMRGILGFKKGSLVPGSNQNPNRSELNDQVFLKKEKG